MRIVGGRLKGRSITSPKGRSTRPTSDRARESLFNILSHAEWAPSLEGARVIDVFAGTGALGFEAMSRGAVFCLFVEIDAAARGAIRENAEAYDLLGTTRIHRRSAAHLGLKPAGLGAPFDIAFMDPPYRKELVGPAIAALRDGGWLTENGLVVLEIAHDESIPEAAGFTLCDQRTYGEAQFVMLLRSAAESAPNDQTSEA